MNNRRYYSIRTGKNPNAKNYDLTILKLLFRDLYLELSQKEYFQEAYGYCCVYAGEVAGTLGYLFRAPFQPYFSFDYTMGLAFN